MSLSPIPSLLRKQTGRHQIRHPSRLTNNRTPRVHLLG